jgi:hypothetical protein
MIDPTFQGHSIQSVGEIFGGVWQVIPDGWQSRAIGEVCDAVSVGIVVRRKRGSRKTT